MPKPALRCSHCHHRIENHSEEGTSYWIGTAEVCSDCDECGEVIEGYVQGRRNRED